MNTTEHYIVNSNNVITMTLKEAGVAITGAWTDVDIDLVKDGAVALNISRTSDSAGIALASGILTITPGALTEDDSVLVVGAIYQVIVTVKTGASTYGIIFGGIDSDTQMFFLIAANTAP